MLLSKGSRHWSILSAPWCVCIASPLWYQCHPYIYVNVCDLPRNRCLGLCLTGSLVRSMMSGSQALWGFYFPLLCHTHVILSLIMEVRYRLTGVLRAWLKTSMLMPPPPPTTTTTGQLSPDQYNAV